MSRPKKDITAKKATQRDSNLEKQIHSDQMIALQGQIDLCQQQRRQLIQSRNYAIIVAALACLVVFYQWFRQRQSIAPASNIRWSPDNWPLIKNNWLTKNA
jgi:hypothetical protein